MSAKFREPAPPDARRAGTASGGYHRLAWACLPLILSLIFLGLLLLGVSWWTAIIVVLLLACPAVIGLALYIGFDASRSRSALEPSAPTPRRDGTPDQQERSER